MRSILVTIGLACALTGGMVLPAAAHHSLSAFDMTKRFQAEGTVREFRWTNPHTWIRLVTTDDKGAQQEWMLEGGSVSILARNGWTWQTLKAGDRISLSIAPRKDGSLSGHFTKVTLPDGTVMPETPDF